MEKSTFSRDPRIVLGVGPDATDEQIRAAYLRKLKEFPPDRSPADFEQVRMPTSCYGIDASVSDTSLFSVDPLAPLDTILEGDCGKRKFVGPEPWLAVLKQE